mgnify:CR=1 FL=1
MSVFSIAEYEIARWPWERLREACGSAEQIPLALIEMLNSQTPEAADSAYWKLENHVVVQGQLFEAAEFVVSALMASLLEERPLHVRVSVLELLFQIVSGEPHEDEIRLGNIDLAKKCQAKALEGLWLLYHELLFGLREAAQEILEVIEKEPARLRSFLDL